MINKNILRKAIEKAKKNGYKVHCSHYIVIFDPAFAKAIWGNKRKAYKIISVPSKNYIAYGLSKPYAVPAHMRRAWYIEKGWQYHLQQMVINKDPIKYLKLHL